MVFPHQHQHRVDRGIHGDDALAQFDIAIDQGLDGIGNLAFREPAHLGDLAGDLLQVGVKRFRGVVDSRRGEICHDYYPKRPVM